MNFLVLVLKTIELMMSVNNSTTGYVVTKHSLSRAKGLGVLKWLFGLGASQQ